MHISLLRKVDKISKLQINEEGCMKNKRGQKTYRDSNGENGNIELGGGFD